MLAHETEQLLVLEAKEQPDAVLLVGDLQTWADAVRQIREASEVPIFIVSSDDVVAAAALLAGADAALIAPFSRHLLIAYVESIVRRAQSRSAPTGTGERYRWSGLLVDFATRTVTVDGRRIHLTAREFRLLQVLARNAGRILSHDQLLRLVWGPGYEECGDLLRAYIKNLRRKLGDNARHSRFVHTESQVGYWMPRPDSTDSSEPFSVGERRSIA